MLSELFSEDKQEKIILGCVSSSWSERITCAAVCVCSVRRHPHGGRMEAYISLKVSAVMTSPPHHSPPGLSLYKTRINVIVSFVRPTKIFSSPYKNASYFFLLTCEGETDAPSYSRHTHRSTPNCLERSLKIEQSNKSNSGVMSSFKSKKAFLFLFGFLCRSGLQV